MHASWFEYNITRPYPFRWFTPLAVIGGIIFTILFSSVNLGASGFYLATKYTNDDNTTLKEGGSAWYLNAPFNWGDHLSPTCEVLSIPVGYQFFTTNLGLRYDIATITRLDEESGATEQLPSFSYLNNTLQNCRMTSVRVDLRKADNSAPMNWWWSWDNTVSTAYAMCTVETVEGAVNISFTTPFSTPLTDFSYLIQDNFTSHGSLWWGSRLLNLYWYGILVTMARVQTEPRSPSEEWFVKGMLEYTSTGNDVKQYDYFNLGFYMLRSDGTLYNVLPDTREETYNSPEFLFSQPMTEALQYAKMFRSLLAIDLGNNASSNLLLDEDLLQYAIYSPDDTNRHFIDGGQRGILNFTRNETTRSTVDWFTYNGINRPGNGTDPNFRVPINESYPLFGNQIGPLETKDATIYAQYACSVPQRKSIGTLILAIVLADLVFLQAVWKLYKLVADHMVDRSPLAQMCRGCLGDDTKLMDLDGLPHQGHVVDDTASTTRLIDRSEEEMTRG